VWDVRSEPFQRLSVGCSVETWDHLKEKAAASGRSLAQTVEWFLLQGLEKGDPVPVDEIVLQRNVILKKSRSRP